MPALRSRARLKAPFVVTVALAGAGACGGTVATGGSGSSVCPDAQPRHGGSCDLAGGPCEYGDCYGTPTTIADCVDGVWSVMESSCNPPAPPGCVGRGCTPTPACPETQPATGAPCAPTDPAICEYGDCYGVPEATATCDGGSWTVLWRSCNPPPPAPTYPVPPQPPVPIPCPESTPDPGSPCLEKGQHCSYGDCYGVPTTDASCLDGAWSVSVSSCNPPAPSPCPETMPWHGAACFGEGTTCTFESCYGEPTSTATCTGGAWSLAIGACNPPPPEPGCVISSPSEGAPCAAPEGTTCFHGALPCASSPGLVSTCRRGAWRLESSVAHCFLDAGTSLPPDADGGTSLADGGAE